MKNTMKAAVYIGKSKIKVQDVPIPQINDYEVLLKVDTVGLCKTDVKKVVHNLLDPPRIFGHEIVGKIVEKSKYVKEYKKGDRVAVFHHVPCLECYFCLNGNYSQCKTYQSVDTTAGFGEPSGGGFAEYVKIPDLVVKRGLVKIPDNITFDEAVFIEPTNCCVKAIDKADIKLNDYVMVLGQGPTGLTLSQLSKLRGATVIATDLVDYRLKKSKEYGADYTINALKTTDLIKKIKLLTNGRGVDKSIVAVESVDAIAQAIKCTRNGGRVIFFFDLIDKKHIPINPHIISHKEIELIGSYSSAWDAHDVSARLIFEKKIQITDMITHKFGLSDLEYAIKLAEGRRHFDWRGKQLSPKPEKSLKILIKP